MKVLLRIISYFGGSLIIIATKAVYGDVSALALLGLFLVIVAVVEALIRYCTWE